MKRNLGILMPPEEHAYNAPMLLGKPIHTYVEQAIADADISLAATRPADSTSLRALLAADLQCILLASDNAPCLSAKTYAALLATAKDRPAAVLLADLQTPLAMALPAALLRALPDGLPATLAAITDWLNSQSLAVKVVHEQDPDAYIAVTDARSFGQAYRAIHADILESHLQAGVVMLAPENTIIEADVRIGEGTILYPGNTLQGSTVIGEGCILYPNNRLQSAVIGDGVTIESSVLIRCKVGAQTTVGPFAYLRPDAAIGEHCRIGDFVEIKNSAIGDGTKVSHLTYVGDSDLGKNINLGCGVVFVNYDGKTKNRSRVEDNAFIGCNCNLIAPVHIGKDAYIAAGSTVVEDVPDEALFVARSRGVIKEEWVKRRKEQGKL